MAQAEAATAGARTMGAQLIVALRDAGTTALIAFGLFLPLIGFQTVTDIRNALILTTRWPLLFALVGSIAALRFLYLMVLAPRRQRGGLRLPQPVLRTLGDLLRNWFIPFAVAFVIVYPMLVVLLVGFVGAARWIDNFGIQILIYVMLGWGLNLSLIHI